MLWIARQRQVEHADAIGIFIADEEQLPVPADDIIDRACRRTPAERRSGSPVGCSSRETSMRSTPSRTVQGEQLSIGRGNLTKCRGTRGDRAVEVNDPWTLRSTAIDPWPRPSLSETNTQHPSLLDTAEKGRPGTAVSAGLAGAGQLTAAATGRQPARSRNGQTHQTGRFMSCHGKTSLTSAASLRYRSSVSKNIRVAAALPTR